MENQFLIDSEYLSAEALEKKHRLETDPSSRKVIWNICQEWNRLHQMLWKSHESDELL